VWHQLVVGHITARHTKDSIGVENKTTNTVDQQVLMNLTDLEQAMHDVHKQDLGQRHVCAFFTEGLKKLNGMGGFAGKTQLQVMHQYLKYFESRVRHYQGDLKGAWERLRRYRTHETKLDVLLTMWKEQESRDIRTLGKRRYKDDIEAVEALEELSKREANLEQVDANSLRLPNAESFWKWLVLQPEYAPAFGGDTQVAWSTPWERARYFP
jgi:hypothetical protein